MYKLTKLKTAEMSGFLGQIDTIEALRKIVADYGVIYVAILYLVIYLFPIKICFLYPDIMANKNIFICKININWQ